MEIPPFEPFFYCYLCDKKLTPVQVAQLTSSGKNNAKFQHLNASASKHHVQSLQKHQSQKHQKNGKQNKNSPNCHSNFRCSNVTAAPPQVFYSEIFVASLTESKAQLKKTPRVPWLGTWGKH